MPKSSQAAGDVADERPIQRNLRHGSRGGFGSTRLAPETLRRHNQLAFLQHKVAQEHLPNIVPPTFDPEVNVDSLRRSLMGSADLRSVVSPSLATPHEGPRPEGALVVVGNLKDDEEDGAHDLHRFIVAERVQRKKEEAPRVRMEAQLKETPKFIEAHGLHNQMVKEAKCLDSMEEVVCKIATSEFVCRGAHGRSPVCHLRRRLDRLGSKPTRPAAPASEASLPLQPQQAKGDDSMAIEEGVHYWFPTPEHIETMTCDREVEQQACPAPVHHAQHSATSASSVHHAHRVVE